MSPPRKDPRISFLIFVIAASATLPQLYQTVTTDLTRDISLWSIVLNLVANALLGYYSWTLGDSGLLAIGIWFTAYWVFLLAYKVSERHN
jgi:uncharacterized protein with PQ loop repeat